MDMKVHLPAVTLPLEKGLEIAAISALVALS